jgi:hypothetical protein
MLREPQRRKSLRSQGTTKMSETPEARALNAMCGFHGNVEHWFRRKKVGCVLASGFNLGLSRHPFMFRLPEPALSGVVPKRKPREVFE